MIASTAVHCRTDRCIASKAFAERPQPPPQAAFDPIDSIKAANNLLYDVEMCNLKREFDTKRTKIIMEKKLEYLQSQTFEDNVGDDLFSRATWLKDTFWSHQRTYMYQIRQTMALYVSLDATRNPNISGTAHFWENGTLSHFNTSTVI